MREKVNGTDFVELPIPGSSRRLPMLRSYAPMPGEPMPGEPMPGEPVPGEPPPELLAPAGPAPAPDPGMLADARGAMVRPAWAGAVVAPEQQAEVARDFGFGSAEVQPLPDQGAIDAARQSPLLRAQRAEARATPQEPPPMPTVNVTPEVTVRGAVPSARGGGTAARRAPGPRSEIDSLRLRALRGQLEGQQNIRTATELAQEGLETDQRAREDLAMARELEMERANARLEQDLLAQQRIEADTRSMREEWERRDKEANDFKIDPDRYWKNRSGFATVLTALASALGGWLEGVSDGRIKNTVPDQISRAIDRDIDAQRAELEGKRRSAEQARNALREYTEAYGSPKAAREIVRAGMLGQASREAENLAAKASDNRARERMLLAKDELDLRRDQALTQANQAMIEGRMAEYYAQQRALAAGAAARSSSASKGEIKAAEDEALQREARLRDQESIVSEYERWTVNPPKNAEERAAAKFATERMRALYWSGVMGRADAPSGSEGAARDATIPGASPEAQIPVPFNEGQPVKVPLPEFLAPTHADSRRGAAQSTKDWLAKERQKAAEARAKLEQMRSK